MNSAGVGLAGAFASESETEALGMDDFGEKGPSLETENPFRKVGCTNPEGDGFGENGPSLETENPGRCELSRSDYKLRDKAILVHCIAHDLAARPACEIRARPAGRPTAVRPPRSPSLHVRDALSRRVSV